MHNHYKSQLVIKRFNRKVWFYDFETRKLEQKQSKNIFYGEDIYSNVVEEKLHRLETSYSNLIDKKVLNCDEIRLTRKELYLIKKFLLVDSLRQMYGEGQFVNYFKSFEHSARHYFQAMELNSTFNPRNKMFMMSLKMFDHKYISEYNLPEQELYMKCLECILDYDIFNLFLSPCPLDLIAWSVAITESYLTFWDSNDDEEFILTDTNMMGEYDMCHMVFGGLNTEKISYLQSKIKTKEGSIYCDLIKTNTVMYENYNIFNLSNTRSIVCINPFFKLYNDRMLEFDKNKTKVEKPNIWPGTTIHHLDAYDIPKNIYKISSEEYTKEDIFIYRPYKLTLEETLAINMQFLNESKQFIGFVNKDKVKRTFAYANVALSFYESSHANNTNENPFAGLEAMVDSMMNNKFYPIMKELYVENEKVDFDPFKYFTRSTDLSKAGMETNYYMYEYFVEQLKNNPNLNLKPFEFLIKQGCTDLVALFENHAKIAHEHNKEFMDALFNNKL